MQIVDLETADITCRTALALGYFDTFHRGHQRLLDIVLDSEYAPAMFTFAGNLYAALGKTTKPVFSEERRMRYAESCGIRYVVTMPADRAHLDLSPEAFFELLLRVNPAVIAVGQDFRFGKDAAGDVVMLERLCHSHHILLRVQKVVLDCTHSKIGTYSIRRAVQSGNMRVIKKWMGRYYSVEGVVEHGRGMGQSIGIPTANFRLDTDVVTPCEGVYAAYAQIGMRRYRAVCSIGGHPTVGDMRVNVETYILDFSRTIYGCRLEVLLVHRLRDIIQFDSVDALRVQIENDIRMTENILNNVRFYD